MEIPTLQEVLDANSLEHKLQTQIKAALDAADVMNETTTQKNSDVSKSTK